MNHTPKKRILVSLGLWNSIHLHFYITKPEKKRKKFSQRSPLQRTFVWHTVKDWIQHRIFDCFLFHLTCHELIYSELIFKRKTYFLSRTEWNWFFFLSDIGQLWVNFERHVRGKPLPSFLQWKSPETSQWCSVPLRDICRTLGHLRRNSFNCHVSHAFNFKVTRQEPGF